MDDIVQQAMAKWPNVPDCRGWLGLDARGRWFMRDDAAQAAGPFAGEGSNPQSKGRELLHAGLQAFIGRNYAANALGEWYFQNGPQRVYVELERTPWILRLDASESFNLHTGASTAVTEVMQDDEGFVYGATAQGLGLIHTADMWRFSEWLAHRSLELQSLPFAAIQQRFGFVLSPAQKQKPA